MSKHVAAFRTVLAYAAGLVAVCMGECPAVHVARVCLSVFELRFADMFEDLLTSATYSATPCVKQQCLLQQA